jgi:oxygen-independent coproporphyrinogen-3 oxidase
LRRAAERGLAVSADIIAGVPWIKGEAIRVRPTEKLSIFARDLIDAGATHISVYDLSLEDGTPLSAKEGGLSFPDEDEDWEARRRMEESLGVFGMRRYEVSNYAAPGFECLHNLAYWRMDSYIGAGPGAVSTIARNDGASLRIEEPKSVEGYGLPGPREAVETRILFRDAAFESIMMAFRTRFGLDLGAFRQRFGMGAEDLIGETLDKWAPRLIPGEPWPSARARGEQASRDGGIALDGAGLDILNRFLGECLEEIEGHTRL